MYKAYLAYPEEWGGEASDVPSAGGGMDNQILLIHTD